MWNIGSVVFEFLLKSANLPFTAINNYHKRYKCRQSLLLLRKKRHTIDGSMNKLAFMSYVP